MNTTGFMKPAGAVVALALLAACAGGSAVAPPPTAVNGSYIGKTLVMRGRPVTAARLNLNPLPYYKTTVPDADAKTSKDFEYTINFYGTYASIFDYPKSVNQIGTINNVGGQGCTNVLYGYGKKTFWIMAAYDQITEYSVPSKQIDNLSVSSNVMPSSCAINTSGDLAVGILDGTNSGGVYIWKKAKGDPAIYTSPLSREYFDGYDNKGNLFFDGFTPSYQFQLEELPKGGKTVQTITTSNTVQFPGSVQWDGKYLTVFDQLANDMYLYTVKGTTATLKKTIAFQGSSDCAQTWIATGVVYCGDAGNDNGEVFKYPAGGSPVATFVGNFDEPLGTVAAAK
jgi:hypothetical protein